MISMCIRFGTDAAIILSMNRLNNNKGFTLLETILTTIILSVGIFGAMLATQNATANSVSDDSKTVAVYLANEQVEEVISEKSFQGYNYVLAKTYTTDDEFAQNFPGYTKSVQIEEVSSSDLNTTSSGSGYMKVTVTVAWGNGTSEQIQVATLLTNIM